jgi:uncharacterized membrane protein YfcA
MPTLLLGSVLGVVVSKQLSPSWMSWTFVQLFLDCILYF